MAAIDHGGRQTNNLHWHTRSDVLSMLPGNNPKQGTLRSTTRSPSKSASTHVPPRLETQAMQPLPRGRTHANLPLGEVNHNRERGRSTTTKVPVEVYEEATEKTSKGLHKRTKSTLSLKSLTGKSRSKTEKSEDKQEAGKPKKQKSSSNLAALLSRSSKSAVKVEQVCNKENHKPPPSTAGDVFGPTPIWAQFASIPLETSGTSKVPLNNSWNFNDEAELYTPQDYSPSKGRNFQDYQPTLGKKAEKPKSIQRSPVSSTSSIAESILRRTRSISGQKSNDSKDSSKDLKGAKISKTDARPVKEHKGQKSVSEPQGLTDGKRGSRVLAAVAAWNTKVEDAPVSQVQIARSEKLEPETIAKEFELMLETRNIAPDVREKMRALDTNMKADLIKQNKSSATTTANEAHSSTGSRPELARAQTDGASPNVTFKVDEEQPSPKKSRPRSLTFNFGKNEKNSKKQKSERSTSHHRNKSELVKSPSSTSLHATAAASGGGFFSRTQKPAIPEDYVTYLRKVQTPTKVELEKLQKLRQLLRNETVAWVDSFITLGGMKEIVALLDRIIDMEWREEHEDSLLHLVLNCLKALLTTSLALSHLATIQATLFPRLVRLNFSSGDEKKGPAEFTTRNIIFSLLFIYLSTSAPTEAASRARILLGYLRDPLPAEAKRPPGFIAEMHRPRPYKIWCKEVDNITKEVFWIFLHHVNVIPYPEHLQTANMDASYAQRHFPVPRAPVAAAPYVGGVEWEATTYVATHIDLLNGIMASLPSREERNALREELRDSGFEKVMGSYLRTCKEKFYGSVHAGLGTWIGAAREDGWDARDVREGPRKEAWSPKKSPRKGGQAPMLDMPKLEVPGLEIGGGQGWL